MDRAKWYQWHSWVGLKLSILISFIFITGTLAVFSHELDWLSNSAKRVTPETVTELNWSAIYLAAQQQYPDNKYQNLAAPRDPWFSAELVYFVNDNERRRAFFHPTTGQFLGEGRWYNWQRFFRMAHRHLMLPTIIGVSIVGMLAVFLLISFISSFYIYPKWWQGFFRWPRRQNRKVFWGDMHRLIGVWSLWFIFIIAVTGIWYLAEKWGANAVYPSKGKAITEQALSTATKPSVAVFNRALSEAKMQYPELELENIRFATKAGQGLVFTGQAQAVLVRPRANLISFDPVSGDVLTINKATELSFHGRVSEAADPLHFGTFAGMTSKIIYFVFGCLLSALSLTGIYIFAMRITRVRRGQVVKPRYYWSQALANMNKGKYISYFLLVICALLTTSIFTGFYAI